MRRVGKNVDLQDLFSCIGDCMNKFRPQDLPKSYIMKERLKTGRSNNYNWQSRVEWYPANWSKHKQMFARRFARLHYLACHAPGPVKKRWWKAYDNFMAKHFGTKGKASMRYLNKRSAHSWLWKYIYQIIEIIGLAHTPYWIIFSFILSYIVFYY